MNDNRVSFRLLCFPFAGALTLLALGCTQPTSSDAKETTATESTAEKLVEQPTASAQPISCQTARPATDGVAPKAGATLARQAAAETDPMYRAPSTPKPEPDLAAIRAAGAKLAERAADPKVLERQAQYVAALPALEAKHPQRGAEFEKERAALKERIINGEGK